MDSPQPNLVSLRGRIDGLAVQLERSRSRSEALEIAIKAAETCMQAIRLVVDPDEKRELSNRASQFLVQAEQIKAGANWAGVVRSVESDEPIGALNRAVDTLTLREPASTRQLTTKEKILLLRGSFLHGFKFPPWEGPPDSAEFELPENGELYLDQPDLPLSDFQEEVFDGWKRPAEALPPPYWPSDDIVGLKPIMHTSGKVDLVQDAATDCSVVASLCAGITRLERGYARISKAFIYPYDAENDHALPSANGKYISRLNFNGCFRKVVIDDRLPTSSTERVMHVIDRYNPSLLWPALVEKAYLKVRGGYNFPGSNSGTDLWIMTGWIPEQIFLQSDELDIDRFWQRIFKGFRYGDVLITTGTGSITSEMEHALGLVGEHDYAVLDMKEQEGQRLLLIKNPWCEGPSWKWGAGSPRSNAGAHSSSNSETAELDTGNISVRSTDLSNKDDHELLPGTFWMDLTNVIQNFESMYLNWNPGLFKHRQDFHFPWDLASVAAGNKVSRGRFSSLRGHPQYVVKAHGGGAVWIVLCRHFQNAVPADATSEEIEDDRFGVDVTGHISLSAFHSGGYRVLLPDKAFQKGWFVDSPQTLLKLDDCHPGVPYTIVPTEQDLPSINHTLTLSAFSNSPISLEEAIPLHQHSQFLESAWTIDTAGGNAQCPTYNKNPQFSINLSNKASIAILLESTNDELNLHVKLIHAKGQRVHVVRNRDIVFDSKDYRRGCCLAEAESLDPGQYTIVCSTFEPQQLGRFTIIVDSSEPLVLKAIPPEGAGRICIQLSPIIFRSGQNRLALPLFPRRLARLFVRAQADRSSRPTAPTPPSRASPIRLSIQTGRGFNSSVLVVSDNGVYSEIAPGVRTPEIDLGPNTRGYNDRWLILERMAVGSQSFEEAVSLQVFVDMPNALEYGEWQIWDD